MSSQAQETVVLSTSILEAQPLCSFAVAILVSMVCFVTAYVNAI